MVTIQLVTGQKITTSGQTVEAVTDELLRAKREGNYARFDLPTGREYVEPAHVVRVTDN